MGWIGYYGKLRTLFSPALKKIQVSSDFFSKKEGMKQIWIRNTLSVIIT